MLNLSSLIPPWVKVAAVVVVIAVAVTAIYQWRADIKTAAFNQIFKEQVQDLLKEQDQRWKDREDVIKSQQDNLSEQIEEQKKITERFRKADEDFRKQGFKNNPSDPAMTYTFDQIRRMEDARKGSAIAAPAPPTSTKTPATTPGTSASPTLDQWKAQRK